MRSFAPAAGGCVLFSACNEEDYSFRLVDLLSNSDWICAFRQRCNEIEGKSIYFFYV